MVEWLGKAGITLTQARDYGILWSDSRSTLYIPVKQEGFSVYGPIVTGYVLRAFDPKGYLTLSNDNDRFWGLLRASEGHPEMKGTLVLVEDVLSGLRVQEICDTLILCGTELRPTALSAVIKEGYRKAIIFLDGDNPTVKMKARKIQKRLSWLNPRIIETGLDPKLYPKSQLEKLIHEQLA